MADESAARDYSLLAEPVAPSMPQPDIHIKAPAETAPATKIDPATQPQAIPAGRVAVSAFEKILLTVTGIAVVALATVIVATQISVANAQRSLQDVEQTISAVQAKNSDAKQTINEIMQSSHLNTVAAKDGLTFNEANIRNVGK
ncbi:protein required for the initiation of cell division [Loigolactobacillus zhaoyuanensis]|uniref:Protein required for the initiation of cell division n=1 Tax=Loigolactobacillus zhaoyuanensis TaxID=2486017 RepID=A0ABW8UBE0_9LACO|nr:protein required for the initiation of cell division [Loigolactobacillus zhaoyuanensis]